MTAVAVAMLAGFPEARLFVASTAEAIECRNWNGG
jgi:hypothetical protein